MFEADDGQQLKVIVNAEEQYSLWPARKPIPDGWRDTGFEGVNKDCVRYVDENWTDMRPLSLRQ